MLRCYVCKSKRLEVIDHLRTIECIPIDVTADLMMIEDRQIVDQEFMRRRVECMECNQVYYPLDGIQAGHYMFSLHLNEPEIDGELQLFGGLWSDLEESLRRWEEKEQQRRKSSIH